MSFLPIVRRELGVASRRKSTYRIRSWTTVIAVLTSFLSIFFIWVGGGRRNFGEPLFGILAFYAFALSALAGVFLTADSLSEEKREGTLGLLFLTDLRGYDVVFGKFLAMSLNAAYGLIALLPVLALPLMLGGVTGGEFWRMALVLMNTLFFSLATGIGISALVRDSRKAMGSALLILLLMVVALPVLAGLLRAASWSLISPFAAFAAVDEMVYVAGPGRFWGGLLAAHLCGWFWIGLASHRLPRNWQEGKKAAAEDTLLDRLLRKRSQAKRREALRQRLLPINPVLWLMGDAPVLRYFVWAIVLVWASLMIGLALVFWRGSVTVVYYGAQVCGLLLKMLIAIQACRFFADARRNGSLELLLCTPLRNTEILKGQWLAMRRIFFWPLLLFLIVNFLPGSSELISAVWSGDFSKFASTALETAAKSMLLLWLTLGFVAQLFAIMWFGMWLALTMKKPTLAAPATFLFVVVLPSFLFCFAILATPFFILWGAVKLQQDLRWIVARQYERSLRPPVLVPPRISAPPIITR